MAYEYDPSRSLMPLSGFSKLNGGGGDCPSAIILLDGFVSL